MTYKTIIDLDDALNRALGDAAFLKMLFDEFQQTLPDFVSTIEQAVQNGDMPSIEKNAHQLKGASANLGVVSISAVALTLERLGKNGEPIGAEEALNQLKSAVQNFNQQLAEIDWVVLSE